MGKVIYKKHLPTMAGLNAFCPNPPKAILPTATPTTIPTTAIQKGSLGGREREKIKQVTNTAEVTGFPCLNVNMASVKIPNTKTTRTRAKDLQPNR
jgi:hypothetical protein